MKKYCNYIICLALIVFLVSLASCAKRTPKRVKKKPVTSISKVRKAPKSTELLIITEEKRKKKIKSRRQKPSKREESAKRGFSDLTAILPTYFNNQDGSDMAYIPAGYFTSGDDNGEENERPISKLYLPSYLIDIYEITVRQYLIFDIKYKNAISPDCDMCPVTNVNWEEATNYCKWAGKRLPTEMEWEKAARGTQNLKWPWGNSKEKNRANVLIAQEPPLKRAKYDSIAPVGNFPRGASVYGVLDLTGNVWEWTDSFYLPYKGNSRPDIRYKNKSRVLRGGSWKNILENARTTYRHPLPAGIRLPNIGFRCAKDIS